ncbi:hypothetical protein M3J09_000279 [Ascochyta lentis]
MYLLDVPNGSLCDDNRDAMTSFFGSSSELQWLRAATMASPDMRSKGAGETSQMKIPHASTGEHISSYNFWDDTENTESNCNTCDDPYEPPHIETAKRLLSCYITVVHDKFPILHRETFINQSRGYLVSLQNGHLLKSSLKWQAILNIVLAISASYLGSAKDNSFTVVGDHATYQARAEALIFDKTTSADHPDIPHIQALGLLSFYWLSVGQASRALAVVGTAISFAYALGLHLRNEDPSAPASKRDLLGRIWWSLYSLENTLSVATGRPSIIADSCCSVPLPLAKVEDQGLQGKDRRLAGSCSIEPESLIGVEFPQQVSQKPGAPEKDSEAYFKASIDLCIITRSILVALYSANSTTKSSTDIRQDIAQLSQRLDQWITSLPMDIDLEVIIETSSKIAMLLVSMARFHGGVSSTI